MYMLYNYLLWDQWQWVGHGGMGMMVDDHMKIELVNTLGSLGQKVNKLCTCHVPKPRAVCHSENRTRLANVAVASCGWQAAGVRSYIEPPHTYMYLCTHMYTLSTLTSAL